MIPGHCIRIIATVLCLQIGAWAYPPTPPPGLTYDSSYAFVYNFDTGAQGWELVNCGGCPAGTTRWIDPALEPSGPIMPDGMPSGSSGLAGLAQGGGGGGSLYLPGINASGDESIARRRVQDLYGITAASSFVFQVDVYIPNLSPMAFPQWDHRPGSELSQAGICIRRAGDGKPMCLEGNPHEGHLRFRDYGGCFGGSWVYPKLGIAAVRTLEEQWQYPGDPQLQCQFPLWGDTWWDDWVTLHIDCNYTRPGWLEAWAYIPWTTPYPDCQSTATRPPGWVRIAELQTICDPAQMRYDTFEMGGLYSWTDAQFDNAILVLGYNCAAPAVDADGDGDVDQDDFGVLQRCLNGPDVLPEDANCLCHFDRDLDNDVDVADLEIFLNCAALSGSAIPAPPHCDDPPPVP